jgi:fructose-1-phosphate kinase PfkB-like protein
VAGKGVNTCRVLTQLGEKCIQLTHLGGYFKDFLLGTCRGEGLDIRYVESGSEIRFCTTVLVEQSDGNSMTELVEESPAVEAGTEARALSLYREIMPACGCVIISGTKAQGYSDGLYPLMVKEAKAAGKFVVLDIKGKDLKNSLEYRPDVIKPNLEEFTATFGGDGSKEAASAACAEVYKKYGCKVVLTRGADCIWYADGEGFHEEPAQRVTALNPIGSGDSFTAGMSSILCAGGSLKEAVRKGAECGALNAKFLKPGTIK